MAFWGIEVKPGKPFTHCCEKSKGRLRISQATLGIRPIEDATPKGVVQCNVGNRRPVLLCALLPNKTESCHLDLEFEEADDVVFSVIGPQSVYLTGYYLQKNQQSNHQSDTDSYGVDIENTQTEGSSFCSDDDKYDDSFIDDVELQVSPSAPVLSLKVDDTALENDTPNDIRHGYKKLRKRNQEIQSDGDETHKTEDEHGYLLSMLKSRRCLETTMSDDAENIAQVLVELGEKAEDSGNCGSKPTEKVDPDISGKPEREAMMGLDDKGWVNIVKNEGPNKAQTLVKIVDSFEKYLADDKLDRSVGEATINDQHLPLSNENDCSQLLDFNNTKPKRKRRKHSLHEEKNHEFEIDKDQSVLRVKKVQEVESSIDLCPLLNWALKIVENQRRERKNSLKRRVLKKLMGNVIILLKIMNPTMVCFVMEVQQRFCRLQVENIRNKPWINMFRKSFVKCKDELETVLNHDNKKEILPFSQPKKKIKKKRKKKARGEEDMDMDMMNQENLVMKYEDKIANAMHVKKTVSSNGLIVEELAQGPPDGKIAAVGKKIKVFYTAMLKVNGKIFDSNMGGTACSCRLGDEEFIDGWNIGIEGMRIGDKRRLVIPPSVGFGSQGVGEIVPPNSWLMYDIELVNVR